MNLFSIIPENWINANVGNFCDVQLGKMLQNDPSSDRDELKPYLKAINIGKKGLDLSHKFNMWIRPQEANRFRLIKGDILVSEGGDAGRVTIFDDYGEYYFQNAINRVRPNHYNKILPEFIYYWFNFLKITGYVDMICNVATIPHFTSEKVKAAPLALPPLDAQRRITQFLDEKTARIDVLIEKKRELLDRLAEKRQALINCAVTKGLNPDVPMKSSGIDWLGDIPAHWEVLPIRRITTRVATGRTPPSSSIDYFTDGEVNWFTPGDLTTGIEINDSIRKITPEAIKDGVCILFPQGTIFLVGIGATLGKVVVSTTPGSANQQINAILTNRKNSPYFIAYFLHAFMEDVRAMSNGNTLGILNQDGTKSLLLPIPPHSEQVVIASYLQDYDIKETNVIRKITESTRLLHHHRSALITAAVTGNIPELI